MLPEGARIRRGADYAAVMKNGRRARRGAVVVHLAVRKTGGPAPGVRAGFIVSKAVGPAVTRNKVKRRLRHLAAPRLADWPAGADVVVRALPAAAARSFTDLSRDMDEALAVLTRSRR